jgi:hypothetical protein
MRHQAKDIPLAIADASDVFNGTVGIGFGNNATAAVRITQNYLSIVVEFAQCLRVREKTAFTMCNWQTEKRSFRTTVSEWRIIYFQARRDHVTDEAERTIPHERAGQETGFAQNLEPVARAEHKLAGMRVTYYGSHYWRKASDSAATKIIPIRKSSRENDRVKIVERCLFVPDIFGLESSDFVNCGDAILIAI